MLQLPVFVTPVAPVSQLAALGCAAVINIHFCGLISVLNSWFAAGKLRQGEQLPVHCTCVGMGAVTGGQEGWGCSRAVLTAEQSLVLFHPSLPCHLLTFLLPQHPWHVLSTPSSASSLRTKCKEMRLILTFVHGFVLGFFFAEEIEKKLNIYRKGCKIWKMLIFCQVHESC